MKLYLTKLEHVWTNISGSENVRCTNPRGVGRNVIRGFPSLVPRPISFFCVGVGKERIWWISVCGFV